MEKGESKSRHIKKLFFSLHKVDMGGKKVQHPHTVATEHLVVLSCMKSPVHIFQSAY